LISRVLLLVSSILLIALAAWFVDSGRLRNYWLAYKVRQVTRHMQHLPNGQEYYIVVPGGAPPKNGWDVLVALHGYGGSGKNMLLPDLLDIAEDENAILIAPNFGIYDDSRSLNDLKINLNAMLDAVAAAHPVNPRGAVLYGFSRGGMFAMAFLNGYSHRISAIVTDGAPDITLPPAGTYLRPLHFVYGEGDGLQEFTYANAQMLRSLGYTVTFEIVPGAGHQVTGVALRWVREMLRAG
jgi:pimeloyl-ACP methyl ester carboxylesterase